MPLPLTTAAAGTTAAAAAAQHTSVIPDIFPFSQSVLNFKHYKNRFPEAIFGLRVLNQDF